jgi:ABC-type uncharacterized transport system substrate-binding protein
MYNNLAFVDSGGLMAYAPDASAQSRRAADYVDRILRGAKPTDPPIEQPTQYVLAVNLKVAKALGHPGIDSSAGGTACRCVRAEQILHALITANALAHRS